MAASGYFQVVDGFTADTGVIGRSVRTATTVVVEDAHLDPEFVAAIPDLRSEVCAPVVLDGPCLGAVSLESREDLPASAVVEAELAAEVLSSHDRAARRPAAAVDGSAARADGGGDDRRDRHRPAAAAHRRGRRRGVRQVQRSAQHGRRRGSVGDLRRDRTARVGPVALGAGGAGTGGPVGRGGDLVPLPGRCTGPCGVRLPAAVRRAEHRGPAAGGVGCGDGDHRRRGRRTRPAQHPGGRGPRAVRQPRRVLPAHRSAARRPGAAGHPGPAHGAAQRRRVP